MSSLLQFNGTVDRRGVHLQAQKMPAGYPDNAGGYMEQPEVRFTCPKCGREHGRIFEFIRKPKGMFGCWVVFRFNGKDQVPDLSCPLSLPKLPRDAKPMPDDRCAAVWHS